MSKSSKHKHINKPKTIDEKTHHTSKALRRAQEKKQERQERRYSYGQQDNWDSYTI